MTNFSGRQVRARASLIGLGAALLLSVAQSSAAFANEAKVGIDNFAFTPSVLRVKPGTTVVFENHDDITHLVVDADGKFRSQALDTNDKFSVAFDKVGDVNYFCGLHPHMKGRSSSRAKRRGRRRRRFGSKTSE